MTTTVDPKIYSTAANDLQNLFHSIWNLPDVNNALTHREIGFVGDYPAVDTWATALQARLQETWNVFVWFLDGFTPLCNGIATAGYNWDEAEYKAAVATAQAQKTTTQKTEPQKPQKYDLEACDLEDVTRTSKPGDGLHTTLAGLTDAIGQKVPNGDLKKLKELADAWQGLITSGALSGAGNEIRRIAKTFSGIQDAPDQPGMQDLLKKLAAGADAVVAAGKVVQTAASAHHDALDALRKSIVQQAPTLLTGLIGTPTTDDTSITFPAPATASTKSAADQKSEITKAGQSIGTSITSSSLVAKVLAHPPTAVADIDKTTKALSDIGPSIELAGPPDLTKQTSEPPKKAPGDQVPLKTDPAAATAPDVDKTDSEKGWNVTAQAADNPPGYPDLPPGTERDENWKKYLNGTNADGSTRPAGETPTSYPNPNAVNDPGLKVIGTAQTQQGTRYTWGGGSPKGTSQGQTDNGGDADKYHDVKYNGFDCSGLTEYSYAQGTGDQNFPKGSGQQYQYLMNNGGTIVAQQQTQGTPLNTSTMQPGDIIYYGPQGSQHVAMYMGNGVTVETNQSGTPAHSQPADLNPSSSKDWPVTVVRPAYK
ncbi:NlpC/P60 family protein [Nocardia stercoris]|uniref:NlpC/P60 domain-containing protein n=1 Tax=Nocardia stercoris TaxID=2483361 RepID=A0A3M2LDR2_9NOCA|nr:NlpC/P60 family protein [Nocardia stercoris]RMI35166.1 hypothetical protein EBN03_02355 [Nocardia stercoris]